MNREEIMRLEGRELDAAVHECVFGRRVKWATPSAAFNFPFDPDTRMRIPHYSTDIAAAWQVVERMRERGLYFELGVASKAPYAKAWLWNKDNYWQAEGRTAPEAICRAALWAARAGAGDDG